MIRELKDTPVHEEPAFKLNDKVVILGPANRWGFPLDFDPNTELTIINKPIPIHRGGSPKWTAIVDYEGAAYEIWEDSLGTVRPTT